MPFLLKDYGVAEVKLSCCDGLLPSDEAGVQVGDPNWTHPSSGEDPDSEATDPQTGILAFPMACSTEFRISAPGSVQP